MMVASGADEDYLDSLRFLSDCLYQYYQKKVIILIDEYDVPLENAYFQDFYEEMIRFIRSLFESVLKTNQGLEFAVRDMLAFYGRDVCLDKIKAWYDGYLFGNPEVYNPWSVINYVEQLSHDAGALPRPYWSNTSSNSIVKGLIEHVELSGRKAIEKLMEGRTLEIPVHEDITYGDIYKNADNLWNFLFFTGYLKQVSGRQEGSRTMMELAIPNLEIRNIYENTIVYWFDDWIKNKNFKSLYKTLEEGNAEQISNLISDELFETISYYDGSSEGFYHGFMAGLLKGIEDYTVESNREAGDGRPDIILRYKRVRGTAIVLEFKVAKTADEIEKKLDEAGMQIASRSYLEALKKEGYQTVMGYAMVFYRKECRVRAMQCGWMSE